MAPARTAFAERPGSASVRTVFGDSRDQVAAKEAWSEMESFVGSWILLIWQRNYKLVETRL